MTQSDDAMTRKDSWSLDVLAGDTIMVWWKDDGLVRMLVVDRRVKLLNYYSSRVQAQLSLLRQKVQSSATFFPKIGESINMIAIELMKKDLGTVSSL